MSTISLQLIYTVFVINEQNFLLSTNDFQRGHKNLSPLFKIRKKRGKRKRKKREKNFWNNNFKIIWSKLCWFIWCTRPQFPASELWLCHWRCPWCNGYRRRKWTRWHEFKSWIRLIAFHIALIPMNPIILPPTMSKIVGQTRFFSLGEATSLGEGKLWIQTC